MIKFTSCALMCSLILFSSYGYNGSTTAVVTVVGGVIKAKHSETVKKYKRKDCPVCKGKGWYISGDDIQKVPCGYCEPEEKQESEITHPPIIIKGGNCKTKVIKK